MTQARASSGAEEGPTALPWPRCLHLRGLGAGAQAAAARRGGCRKGGRT